MINKSRHLENSYSDWRRSVEDKTPKSYCLDIDFVEYTYKDGKVTPYLLLEVTEPKKDLETCTWFNNVLIFKSEQVSIMKYFSKILKVPWLVVLTQVKNDFRLFKLYNNEFQNEKIYSEVEYINILNKFKSGILSKE